MAAEEASLALPALAREWLSSLEHPALQSCRALWPAVPATLPTPPPAPVLAASPPLAVLEWLPGMAAAPHAFAAPLIDALCRAAPTLEWRQTYTEAEIGTEFLRNYGYTELVSSTGAGRAPRLCCGFLLLGPHTHYPWHHHPAEEIYVPLSGTAAWAQGDAIWRDHPPGR